MTSYDDERRFPHPPCSPKISKNEVAKITPKMKFQNYHVKLSANIVTLPVKLPKTPQFRKKNDCILREKLYHNVYDAKIITSTLLLSWSVGLHLHYT